MSISGNRRVANGTRVHSFRRPGAGHNSRLLKNVNTDALEYAACISTDELELFFTRAGKNGPAIYSSTRMSVTHPFDPPVRVDAIKGFVEAPTLSLDGRSLYYHLREGARFVIYRAARSQ